MEYRNNTRLSRSIICCAFLALSTAGSIAQPLAVHDTILITETRSVYALNQHWHYLEDAVGTVAELPASTHQWQKVNLPHSWNAFDAVDEIPGYRRNAGWYKRELNIPAAIGQHRFVLSFEGINITGRVYVNGKPAGEHIGGYVGFDVDITPFVVAGASNVIHVRADNSNNVDIIPSQKSDFFIYGGITRNVWLRVLPQRFIDRILVKTPKVTKTDAQTECVVTWKNHSAESGKFMMEAVLKDQSGKEVARKESSVELSKESGQLSIKLPTVKNPILWSPANPVLYSVTVSLKESGTTIDQMTERIGYRWFEFKEHGPFFLNGERLLLRGTHRHEDYAGLANALPDSLHRKDMRMIKEMGANFVRLAHYPQAPEVYRACDELGLLVWDELPWCRGGAGGTQWRANAKRLLKEQITQNYNHPSIVIWSLGNESYWLPDVPGGDNPDTLRSVFRDLNDIAHALDPGRLTAVRKIDDAAGIVDVFSPSIWAGWYTSVFKNFEPLLTAAKDKYTRMLLVEYGGDSHVGRHDENPITGDGFLTGDGQKQGGGQKPIKSIALNSDWSESYIVDLFDWHLQRSEQLDWLSGTAQWAFKDFGTPLRPENPLPYINQKGLVDRAGTPKDAYFVFKSYWTTDPQFCYIESHTWTDRSGPANVKREVNVFSNCEEVELFLNGVSQGVRKRDIKSYPACGLNWYLLFEEGANTVVALGYSAKKKVAEDRISISYTYKKNEEAARISLSSEKLPTGNLLITALAVDIKGRRCLDYSKRIYFASLEGGELLVNRGTPTGSSIIEMANGKAQIEFRPEASRRNIVEARNQDFKGSYIVIEP